tara:strand:- start:692 stop:904 length:213 start_codon:yes stop_codon:yes gene_type:complete
MRISKNALDGALKSIAGKAKKARLGDEIPEDERPSGFMISIGIEPMSPEEVESVEEELEEGLEEEEEEEV